MNMIDLTPEQIKESVNIGQLFQVYQDVFSRMQSFKGSMTWKTIHGIDYLYKRTGSQWKCMGVKSDDTQRIFDAFVSGKEKSRDSMQGLQDTLKMHARYAKAARVNRVPLLAANIIRKIQKNNATKKLTVIGTHAIYAYESMAGKYVLPALMETCDIDFMWDARESIKLLTHSKDNGGFLSVLQQADKSFVKTSKPYRAVNRNGFLVDLVTEDHGMKHRQPSIGGKSDIQAAEIGSLEWLINSPKVNETVIDTQGFPLVMRVPDPRCFAIHKLWVSQQPSRSPEKAIRDRQQSELVVQMIVNHLADYPFSKSELRMFPEHVIEDSSGMVQEWSQL